MTESEHIEAHVLGIQDFLKALVFKLFSAQGQNFIFRLTQKSYALHSISRKKYCVRIQNIKHDKFITKVEIKFKCIGVLCKIFNAYEVNPEFNLIFSSDDFTEPNFFPITDLDYFNPKYFNDHELFLDQFKSIKVDLSLQRLEWSVQKFEDFYKEITKPFLFSLLKG